MDCDSGADELRMEVDGSVKIELEYVVQEQNRYGGWTMDCYYAEYCEMHKYAAGGGENDRWLLRPHVDSLEFLPIQSELEIN